VTRELGRVVSLLASTLERASGILNRPGTWGVASSLHVSEPRKHQGTEER
jgi:hypothetical protein